MADLTLLPSKQTRAAPFEMNWTTSTLFCYAVGWLVGPAASVTGAKDLTWVEVPGGRWAALEVPANGKSGFTLLPAEQTGVTFTNTLPVWRFKLTEPVEPFIDVAPGLSDTSAASGRWK